MDIDVEFSPDKLLGRLVIEGLITEREKKRYRTSNGFLFVGAQ